MGMGITRDDRLDDGHGAHIGNELDHQPEGGAGERGHERRSFERLTQKTMSRSVVPTAVMVLATVVSLC